MTRTVFEQMSFIDLDFTSGKTKVYVMLLGALIYLTTELCGLCTCNQSAISPSINITR